MNLRKITTSLIATMAVISLSACFEKKDTKEVKPADNRVEVTKPLVKDIEVWDEYTARIEGEKSVEVRSRVSGYLEKICFTDGDFVKAGDILFEIDPRPFEAMVEASQASVKETEARIELAESNLKRAQELYRANAISREVLETRKSELLSAKAVLMSAQAKLKDAMLNLEFTKTRSPISGYVSRRRVDEGNLIDASTTLMATVVSRDIVYAYFEISERDIIKYTSSRLFESINASERSGPPVKLKLLDENTKIYINPTGRFLIGGPLGDTGLTGRKIIVDTYGGYSRHGGGAFSGKDASKVDRSAAYMLRHVAKNIVANGYADKCEIQVSYAIGMKEPISINVNTFGTGKKGEEDIIKIIKEKFDLTPNGIINYLQLKDIKYTDTTNYGHFGKNNLPWEKIVKL